MISPYVTLRPAGHLLHTTLTPNYAVARNFAGSFLRHAAQFIHSSFDLISVHGGLILRWA